MDRRSQERLSQLSPEVRVGRLQGLLHVIIAGGYASAWHMARFINLYDFHIATVPDRDAFKAQLDQPGVEFWDGTFDDIVEAYDKVRTAES